MIKPVVVRSTQAARRRYHQLWCDTKVTHMKFFKMQYDMGKGWFRGRMRDRQRRRAMYDAIVKLSSYEECCDFFDDLCTGKELDALEQRFEVAKMLLQDNVYLDIMKSTGASSATISRVKRMLFDGTGCLREMIGNSLEEET